MICKKCGKEFNSDNNICTFCNHDNNVEENVHTTETSVPAETVANEQTAPTVENTEVVKTTTETNVEEMAKEEIEDLFADEKKEEEKVELVIEEPVQTTASPATNNPAASTEPVQTTASPATNTPAASTEPVQTTVAPATDTTVVTPASTETTTVTGVQPTEENTKKKLNPKTIIMLLLIVILAVIVVIIYLPKSEKEATNETNASETNTPTAKPNNNNTGNNNENNINTETPTDIFTYSGVYKNGDITITMYALSTDAVRFGVDSVSEILELKNNVLSTEDEFFGETFSIKVEKTADGIKVTSSSSEADSVLNKITNVYTKEGNVTTNWNGIYKNGNVEFIIDQYKVDEIALSYLDSANYMVGQYENIKTFTENTITYESEFFGETTKITITRTATGIDVVATSTDPEEDFTSLNGSFTKQ